MTDNEIMKALKCCNKHNTCNGCPLITEKSCESKLSVAVIDLINRQKAEIERQKEYCLKCAERTTKAMIGLQETLGTARAEAIKEFAERLKDNIDNGELYTTSGDYEMTVKHIDTLVKEMTEDGK